MTDPRVPRLAAEWNRQKADLIAYDSDLIDDELALTDTLDGLADAGDFIAFWARKAREDEAMAEALRSIIDDMWTRKQRLSSRADKQRSLALCLMDAIGEKKIVRPDMTITVNAGRQKVIVTDENRVSDAFKKVVKTIDKTAIREALDTGETVPGAMLSNFTQTLTIRTK